MHDEIFSYFGENLKFDNRLNVTYMLLQLAATENNM